MELRLDQDYRAPVIPPSGFRLHSWSPRLSLPHAQVKFLSFREEIDAHVFPCLGDLDGCVNLMREICSRNDFVPEATWLISKEIDSGAPLRAVGTIQGLRPGAREGAIQNIGVHPEFRDLGLGTLLIQSAINGFCQVGCRRVHLEVTAQNSAAIRLYERLGFRRVETLFKIAEVQYA
jgi:ribosomal protein S18 acetylase RimI-like enzyme